MSPAWLWFFFAFNLILSGLMCYGVYWVGITSGFPVAGTLLGGITFLATSGVQAYAVFKTLRDPAWKPSCQIDSTTYSGLTNAAKMIFGSPLNLPSALLMILRRSGRKESKTDEHNV